GHDPDAHHHGGQSRHQQRPRTDPVEQPPHQRSQQTHRQPARQHHQPHRQGGQPQHLLQEDRQQHHHAEHRPHHHHHQHDGHGEGAGGEGAQVQQRPLVLLQSELTAHEQPQRQHTDHEADHRRDG